ncbi:CbtA family protein [Pseudonocardia sp. CA-107938]|uniref:CbtA family protein n=1 Tax=Pseudonocardia sp. CA-107938 TaxID=3240021 RepID=UPI003D8E71EA
MVRALLVRGMLAGLVAGLFYAVVEYVFGEPMVDAAIAYEDQVAAAAGEAPGAELVSRGVQATLGLGVASALFGVALGGITALVYAAVHGRYLRLPPRAGALALAAAGFVVTYAVPFLKYPANPPASTKDDTIGERTLLFLAMVLASVVIAWAALVVRERLRARLGTWNATTATFAGYVVVVAVVMALLPTVAETPADFPAPVLYGFRIATLGGQLAFWTALGLVFGALVERAVGVPGRRIDADTLR